MRPWRPSHTDDRPAGMTTYPVVMHMGEIMLWGFGTLAANDEAAE